MKPPRRTPANKTRETRLNFPAKRVLVDPPDPFDELSALTAPLKDRIKGGQFARGESDEGVQRSLLLENAQTLAECLKNMRSDPAAQKRLTGSTPLAIDLQFRYLSACCWAAEALEYFGKISEARDVIEEDGRKLYGSLLDLPRPDPNALPDLRPWIRQRVWLILHYCYCCFYQTHQYHKALSIITSCEELIRTKLEDERDFPCYYTWARLWSWRGAIFRQLGQLDEAQRCYAMAVEFCYKRLNQEKETSDPDPQRIADEETRANYEVAKTLALGLGWIQLIRGQLQEARMNVTAALVMLSPIQDVLRRAYAQLLLASIDRASAGFEADKLDRAIAIAKQPLQVFDEYGHRRYKSRADYELSLAYHYRGKAEEHRGNSGIAAQNYATAEAHIKNVLDFSRDVNDSRWECIALTVLCRIARFRGMIDEARTFADTAHGLSSKAPLDVQIALDVNIECGACALAADHVHEGMGYFEDALRLAQNNQKSSAVCHLHLVDAYLRQNDARKALEHFRSWEALKEKLQNGIVRDMGREITARFTEATRGWCVISAEETLNYDEHERRLREFLVRQAATRYKNVDAVARSLGIKRATYYNWLNELKTRN